MSPHPHPRIGKTRRDHASGAWARRLANQSLREDWMASSRGKMNIVPFPAIGKTSA